MRYLIKFSKESDIKFISHLDLMRTIQKVVKRAGLPVEYSKGFNPHMSVSFAQPLAVGVYSHGDYLDTNFTEEVDEQHIVKVLNENSPMGVTFHKAVKLAPKGEKKVPKAMAAVEGARYIITIKYNDTTTLDENLKELLKKSQWITLKKTKSSEKDEDIKPLFKDFKYKIENEKLIIDTTVCCGSKANLSPELVGSFIKSNTDNVNNDAFVDIVREETLSMYNDKMVPLYEYLKKFSI